jgi:PAS domain S-box-containing protein
MRFRIILLLSALCVVLLTALTWKLDRDSGLQDLKDRAAESLALKRNSILAETARYRYLPFVLATDERIKELLRDPSAQVHIDEANRHLEALNDEAGSMYLYVLNTDGLCLASSNWRDAKSFVGNNYRIRPYFKDAIVGANGEGHYYAVGITSGKPGFHWARRVDDETGIVGVTVVKLDLKKLESAWQSDDERVGVMDQAGMIFLSGVPEWQHTPLMPLSQSDIERILVEKQYEEKDISEPPLLQSRFDLKTDVYMGDALLRFMEIPEYGWRIFGAYDVSPVRVHANLAAAIVFLCAALLFVLAFYLLERRQRFRADQLREILENVNAGVAVFDGDLRLVSWNNKYLELNSYPESLIRPGRLLSDIIKYNIQRGDFGPGDPKSQLQERLDRVRKHAIRKTEVRRPDGTWVEIVRSRVPNGTLITTYTDVTERKNTEERLEAQVRDRTAAMTNLVNSISHDIRNPLTAILGYAGLVLSNAKDLLPGKQYQNLQKLKAKADEVSEMVNDFLDYNRADHVALSEFALEPLIRNCLEAIETRIDSQRVKLACNVPDNLPLLNQDEKKLKRIVINLLDNAAKFTEHGSIDISVQRRASLIDISVKDTGVGIAAEYLGRIFEEYKRVESGDGRPREGTGLGLAICRRFALLMGGQITVQSRTGEGARFTLTLPVVHPKSAGSGIDKTREEETGAAAVAESAGNSGPRLPTVLVVDDSRDNRDYLMQLLDGQYLLLQAEDGRKAIELALREAPDIILMDLSMPIVDGWEATRKIKADPRRRAIPIIAVTANATEEDKAEAARAGCDSFLAKPVDEAALFELLRQYLDTPNKPYAS